MWVSLPSVSIFHRPVLMSATKTFPFSSTTMPELGWAEAHPANKASDATTGYSGVKQQCRMSHLHRGPLPPNHQAHLPGGRGEHTSGKAYLPPRSGAAPGSAYDRNSK